MTRLPRNTRILEYCMYFFVINWIFSIYMYVVLGCLAFKMLSHLQCHLIHVLKYVNNDTLILNVLLSAHDFISFKI